MPELPEVETFATTLRQGREDIPPVLGRTFVRAELFWERTLARPDPSEFYQRIAGQTIAGVARRGKFLILRLSRDFLLFHLRMSGDLHVEPASEPIAPHDRLILEFADGYRLAFHDPRKFGRVWLVDDLDSVLGALGPEPFDESLTPAEFYRRLKERRRQLKPLLLDQTFLAGLGNIYTDEALHLARLHPLALSASLSNEQAERLLASIRHVLREGIRRQGASIDWVYRGGDFQNFFRVYRRTGLPCPECGTPILRMVIGQRGTHYCPICQQLNSNTG